jgi:hypothetical protein
VNLHCATHDTLELFQFHLSETKLAGIDDIFMKKSSLNLEAIQRYLISCQVFWPLGLSEKFIVKTSLHFLAGIDNQQVERWI